jgi:peptidoglycan/xylan/chitin deacetylase (PgdA/CDA1 family)
MPLHFDRKVAWLGNRIPTRVLRAALRASLGSRHVALTLHRVRAAKPEEMNSHLSIEAEELDAAIDFLLAAHPRRPERWLTVTFDDGYEDGAAYVESRAIRFPGVDFILFVCPEKAERGAGFRWDLAEVSRQAGEPPRRLAEILYASLNGDAENAREDLHRVAAESRFRLATVNRLRALADLPNVSIGNHTNCHFKLSLLRPDQARQELERSRASFERLFGHQRHFAFPYGHGFFDQSHVRLLRELSDSVLWGTGQSPYAPSDLAAGALVPRVVMESLWGVRGIAAVIAVRSLVTRALGVRGVERRAH